MNAMLNPLFAAILNGSVAMPDQAEMQIKKTIYRCEDVYKKSGRVFGIAATLEEAFNRVTYTREVESRPKAFFSRITEVEMIAEGRRGDEIIWGNPRKVKEMYFV
jgi:hypothetical protein